LTSGGAFSRVGLEAGPLSPWLYAGLVEAGLPAICVETRHMHAAHSARINKTDRNDALGIAQMMRVGLFKAVHVKTPASQQRRLLLTSRKLLQRKAYDIENDLRGQLRNFGLKVGIVGAVGFEARVRELVTHLDFVASVVVPLLVARSALRAQPAKLHKMLLDLVRDDPICRRLMTAPGVGAVVALTYRTCVDNPARFGRSKCVGAHYGLTPRLYQSGETSRAGRVSKCGDAMLRATLYEAAPPYSLRQR
jgi:transposase